MEDLKHLLNLMFSPDTDNVCVSNSKYSYHSMPIYSILSGEVTLVSPNQSVSITKVKTETLTHLALNPIKGFRSDKNCTALRTFLWELDVGSLKSQQDYVEKLGIPTSCSIYSGNKSIHFLTVLDQDIDEKTYRLLFKWACSIGTLFDDQCGNPSRCVRIPGNIRPDTGKRQRLIDLKERVKLDDFMAWLNKYPDLMPRPPEERKRLTTGVPFDRLSGWAKKQFKDGIDFGNSRNKTWFSLGCDLAKSGYEEDEAVEILGQYFQEESDFKEKEWLMAISSGYKHMANKE
jgi:hypothetical protein